MSLTAEGGVEGYVEAKTGTETMMQGKRQRETKPTHTKLPALTHYNLV